MARADLANTIKPEATGRTKNDVDQIRHLYLDVDVGGREAVDKILAVEGMPVGGRRTRRPGPGRGPGAGGMFAGIGSPIPPQDVSQVAANWPAGDIDVRLANYLNARYDPWRKLSDAAARTFHLPELMEFFAALRDGPVPTAAFNVTAEPGSVNA